LLKMGQHHDFIVDKVLRKTVDAIACLEFLGSLADTLKFFLKYLVVVRTLYNEYDGNNGTRIDENL
jgi:hypothetical protein